MKQFLTLLGIAALLIASPAVDAAFAVHNNVWNGSTDSTWNDPDNWNGIGYPGDTACQDTATIDDSQAGRSDWPQMDTDYKILSLTMGDDAQLDANGYTLEVDGTATFDSTDNSGDAGTFITLDNSSNGTNGSVIAETIVINGGASGTLLKVTSSGTEEMTLQCGTVACD
jgi:hypothetical protein